MTNDNQNLTDEEILEQLTGSAEDDLPEDGDDGADEKEKRIRHAFAEKKRTAKEAISMAEKYKRELEELKAKAENNANNQRPPQSTSPDQAAQVFQKLQMEAMNNLGISQVTESNAAMVGLEVNRLYAEKANEVVRRTEAEREATGIVDETLNSFNQLNDADKAEVKKRLNDLDVLQRVNKGNIHQVVSQYLGEKVISGKMETPETETSSRENSAATASATSAVRNGRSGVRSGRTNEINSEPSATPEEQMKMRKLGLTDLKAFRKAEKRKGLYAGR